MASFRTTGYSKGIMTEPPMNLCVLHVLASPTWTDGMSYLRTALDVSPARKERCWLMKHQADIQVASSPDTQIGVQEEKKPVTKGATSKKRRKVKKKLLRSSRLPPA